MSKNPCHSPQTSVANLAVFDDSQRGSDAALHIALHASSVATLVFAMVAGVVSATSDFRPGRIDQLLVSELVRWVILAAKVTVGELGGLLYGLLGAVTAIASTAGYLAVYGGRLDVGSAVVTRPLGGVVLATALFGLLGVALGIAVQNQPAALSGSLALLLLLEPTALLGAPSLGCWLPGATGLALTASPDPELLTQLSGGLLLSGWTVVATIVAARRLHVTDV